MLSLICKIYKTKQMKKQSKTETGSQMQSTNRRFSRVERGWGKWTKQVKGIKSYKLLKRYKLPIIK